METLSLPLDHAGKLQIPRHLADELGAGPDGELSLRVTPEGILLRPSLHQARKVYIEPTGKCNFNCRTCIRHAWEETPGAMSEATFRRVLEGVAAFRPRPSVFFGGFGEPLTHPRIVEMVQAAKNVATRVELITNGVLLEAETARGLIAAGLDTLWVSLDGASPESFADVRQSESLREILENIKRYREAYRQTRGGTADIGAVFVAMRRNIHELPKLLEMSSKIGISRYMVTNVLPYTPEMCQEVLYHRAIERVAWQASPWHPHVSLPEMDLNQATREALFQAWNTRPGVMFKKHDQCPFIEQRSVSIRWDGGVSPCLALLHSHESYLFEKKRNVSAWVIGNVDETPLPDLWNLPEYRAFRERVEQFDFAPCTYCASCEMAEANQEDCFGNTFPACGGCLWAQGVIQCP
ncbi:MAG: radical SAM protein [Anaerolineales bacterium]|nr:radical SAM protein [Anaerolineales bacterium]MCX7753906.1 radical SAM protein [Anaerolineales bacterium]MDW8276860.1 radical SAM protein [Anaerolineales bacterium]